MYHSLKIRNELKINSVTVTIDQAVYAKALEVKSKHFEQFQQIFMLMGGFHLTCIFMSIIEEAFLRCWRARPFIRSKNGSRKFCHSNFSRKMLQLSASHAQANIRDTYENTLGRKLQRNSEFRKKASNTDVEALH